MDLLLPLLTLVIGVLLGAVAVLVWTRRAGDPDVLRALTARGEDQAVLRDGLDRLHERLVDVNGCGLRGDDHELDALVRGLPCDARRRPSNRLERVGRDQNHRELNVSDVRHHPGCLSSRRQFGARFAPSAPLHQ